MEDHCAALALRLRIAIGRALGLMRQVRAQTSEPLLTRHFLATNRWARSPVGGPHKNNK